MPPLAGFTHNAFRTRADVVRAAAALIGPLNFHKSPGKARVRLPFQTGAGFDEVAAQLEGFARPLFAIAPLLLHDNSHELDEALGLRDWISGITSGVDPESEDYWGEIGDVDQRMVETESIALALLLVPNVILGCIGVTTTANLVKWLRGIHKKQIPASNWRWFRIFVNLALIKTLGVPEAEVAEEMQSDFAMLDSFYLGEGWSSDGAWGEERSQADYYSGSFSIQFAQLLFVRFADGEQFQERVKKYTSQAQEFGAKFWKFFDSNGAAIPFGRSMTYRFAFAAFWAATAAAKVDLGPPLSIGAVKGLLLRHLRWWADEDRAGMFHADGTLNIGFAYPNMHLAEDYNSPQSPYWCLKSFIVLALPKTDSFWMAEEEEYPITHIYPESGREATPGVALVWPPRQILISDPSHHYLLSAGQSTRKTFKGRESKYSKFAYSSAFGFSVPSGPLLHQMAADNTIAVQFGDNDFWRIRSAPQDVRRTTVKIIGNGGGGELPCLTSTWIPWKLLGGFSITSTLIPPASSSHSGWHIRLHRLTCLKTEQGLLGIHKIRVVDSGFAIASTAADGRFIPRLRDGGRGHEGCDVDGTKALITSRAGASGVVDLTDTFLAPLGRPGADNDPLIRSETSVLQLDPNTNLMVSRTIMPLVKHELLFSNDLSGSYLATAVFAVKDSAGLSWDEVDKLWRRRPALRLDDGGNVEIEVIDT